MGTTNQKGTIMTTPIVLHGNNLDLLRDIPDNSIDSIVTDPPYELGFMGKKWDNTGIAYSVELWSECLRVLKHGGHLLAFSGSRTYHRMVVAIEDAGFEIRDQIMWVYGSGFPKSLDISKAIDKAAGAERIVVAKHPNPQSTNHKTTLGGYWQEEPNITVPTTDEAQQWSGWGTALKPAHEPIVMARKPIDGTVANNVLKHGVGGINIDGCRVFRADNDVSSAGNRTATFGTQETSSGGDGSGGWSQNDAGRFPANFIHDGSEEVLALFPDVKGQVGMKKTVGGHRFIVGDLDTVQQFDYGQQDSGSAARFFYCAKASKSERNAGLEGLPEQTAGIKNESGRGFSATDPHRVIMRQNFHPTVKPIALMRYLVRLVTPPNGTVLDPFAGSGTTLVAAILEGFNPVGMELTIDYLPIINARVDWALKQVEPPTQPTLF